VVEKSLNPEWNFSFAVNDARNYGNLKIEVWDSDVLFDDFMGSFDLYLPLMLAPPATTYDGWIKLSSQGEIHVTVHGNKEVTDLPRVVVPKKPTIEFPKPSLQEQTRFKQFFVTIESQRFGYQRHHWIFRSLRHSKGLERKVLQIPRDR